MIPKNLHTLEDYRVVEFGPLSPPGPLETHQYLDPADGTICGGLFIRDKSATLD